MALININGVRHVGILPSQILPKHSVESLQMTLRDPTGPREPPPILPEAWIASGKDFPEVDVKPFGSDLVSKVAARVLSPFMIVVFLPPGPIGH